MVRVAIIALLALSFSARAHHSFGALYDLSAFEEINGEIVSVSWINPHVRVVLNADGVTWNVEGQASNQLKRMNVTGDMVRVGDVVRIAGSPARRNANALYWSHLLLADGRELVMRPGLEPRWSERIISDDSLVTSDGASVTAGSGIFRVWMTNLAVRSNFPLAARRDYPLTEAARSHQRTWDIEQRILTCASYGMPTIIDSPDPIEFVDQGDSILMRFETFNAERLIHFAEIGEPIQPSPMGYSVGHWEGDTLVVRTTHIDWPYFNQLGVPQSRRAELIEYFTPSSTRLDYSLTAQDPVNFAEPVTISKYWTWHEGVALEPYQNDPDCWP